MVAFTHLPQTLEGWSVVISSLTGLLNLVVIIFLARYSIRQTRLLASQTAAIVAQTKLMMKEREKSLHRDTYQAIATVSKVMRETSAIQRFLAAHSLRGGQIQPVRPIDWHVIASSLVLAYPTINPLPAEMDVEMTALDDAIEAIQVVQPHELQGAERRVADALFKLNATASKVQQHLKRGIDPEQIMVTTAK